MNKMNCLIVDDEALARRVVKRFLEDVPFLNLVQECKSAVEAINALVENEVDLIFLDINMPKLNGLDFLRTITNPPMVIITTAYREYALESYEFDVVDYITKPFSFDRFIKAVNKAQSRYSASQQPAVIPSNVNIVEESASDAVQHRFFFVKTDKKLQKVDFDELKFVEGFGEYVKLHLDKEVIVTYMTMKNLESSLPDQEFIRIHKSFIISIGRIDNIEGHIVRIGDKLLPIGQGYRKNFMAIIKSHMK
ncbi:LytR/AlgR family response regulator transcription factor [Aureibacter tunicatorum]|uniref:DNA-binding LytR/AlgR family response regulator n=1 Tax=Aureibacter tunicatorum TaxID=866807 RepID=A0AAE3XKT7_9BACT|nr:response regulator transcription factor [Aureibacter tunicatorum]MDR6239676.1 DNA-binding LytR/AlgR family response regulator [Aureibacter tunicatorum]BDD04152.1 DNA-binding response regulator [Aureibacter tunicatorum]